MINRMLERPRVSAPRVSAALATARRVGWTIVGALLAIVLCMVVLVGSMSVVPGYQTSPGASGHVTDLGMLVVLAWMLAMVTLFSRREYPWVTLAAGGLLTVALQLDSLLLLFGAAAVVLHRDRRQGLAATVTAAVLTLVAGVRDGLRPVGGSSWEAYSTDPLSATSSEHGVQLGVSLGIATVAGLVVLGAAWMIRSRRELGATRRARVVAEDRSERLETTTVRLEERERLAREVHDALAHRLSLISLHSGALEEAAQAGDPKVLQAAEVLRDSAHRSLEDLRHLVTALRDPVPGHPSGAADDPEDLARIGLATLPDLVGSARDSGVSLEAMIMVQEADRASDLLDRATYRIVQEALTNTVKHAPGQPVRVEVTAAPAAGVHVLVDNPLGHGSGRSGTLPGSGNGLIGMQERATLLGGILSAGPDERGHFVVEASLPWQGGTPA